MNDPLIFAAEPAPAADSLDPPWLVLVVDDDEEVHAVTRLMLGDAEFENRPLRLLSAHSAAGARELLAANPGIALALVDVVMETEHAGLELVRHIRDERGNAFIRIVLRTGQPGMAPVQDVVSRYAIDDYLTKSDLKFLRLTTLVTTALRTYALLQKLDSSQRQLHVANEALQKLAYLDPLTGLFNRRLFGFSIEREWRRAMRLGLPVTAIMMDVDHFKLYNDSYGHVAGDAVLRQVAQLLSNRCSRAGDVLCRYGGEEFLVFCTGLTLAEGCLLAERICGEVAALGIEHRQSPHQVLTLSLGCSSALLGQSASLSGYESLIQQADEALYHAKKDGRNRVQCGP
ncbi:MAG: diguanylate cyclase [Pseudomonadota bacterium]